MTISIEERNDMREGYTGSPHGKVVIPLLDALEAAERERDAAKQDAIELRDVLRRANFSPCDVPACNCGSWHERTTGNGFYARFQEIDEAIGSHDGMTTLQAVELLVAEREAISKAHREVIDERDAALAERDRLREQGGELFLSGQVAKLREERDAAIAELAEARGAAHTAFVAGADWARFEITGATSFPSERDAAAKVAEQRFPYVPRHYEIVNDELRAELAECKEKLAALVEAVESDKLPLMMTVREALAAAKETP